MNWLFYNKTKEIKKEQLLDPRTIEVESIQGILVKEFELNSNLKEKLQILDDDLKVARELQDEYKLKYEATLLVVSEKEKRLKNLEFIIKDKDINIEQLTNKKDILKKENDDYYSKFKQYEKKESSKINNIKMYLEQSYNDSLIKNLYETEKAILEKLNNLDGRTSKSSIINIIKDFFKEIIDDAMTVAITVDERE